MSESDCAVHDHGPHRTTYPGPCSSSRPAPRDAEQVIETLLHGRACTDREHAIGWCAVTAEAVVAALSAEGYAITPKALVAHEPIGMAPTPRRVWPGGYVGCFAAREAWSGMQKFTVECLLPQGHEGDHDELRDGGSIRWSNEGAASA